MTIVFLRLIARRKDLQDLHQFQNFLLCLWKQVSGFGLQKVSDKSSECLRISREAPDVEELTNCKIPNMSV